MKLAATALCAALMGCTAFAITVAPGPFLPAFEVAVTTSPAAAAKLKATGETITLAAYAIGQKKNPRPDEDPQMALGDQMLEIPGAGVAAFPARDLDRADVAMLDGEVQLLINVYSSRKASEDNILDCGIWQDVLSKLPASKIKIACKLIGEE